MRITGKTFGRRGFILGCALVLAGCAQPQLTGEIEGGLSIKSVSVVTSSMAEPVSGRANTISDSKLNADVTDVLKKRIVGRPGAVQADLVVNVQEVQLVPRAASAIAPLQSTTKVVMSVTERGTGKVIVAPTEITAPSAQLRAGGIIGAATTPTVEKDYSATLQGLANAIEKRLYGKPE